MNEFTPFTALEFHTLTSRFAQILSTKEIPVIIPGEAILGIEALAMGIAATGRKILNVVTGPYGKNFGDWLARGGAEVVELRTPYDEVTSADAVAAEIERSRPCALAFVQAEAVTGGSNPTKEILEIARHNNLVTVVDSVSAIGAEPVLMDEWEIDFVAIGAQKALAGPNGVSAVGISARGWEFLESNPVAPRNSILSLLDLKPRPDESLQVAANIPILEARAAIKALAQIEEEGLPSVYRRHALAAASAIAGIQALSLEPWQSRKDGRSPLVTTVRIPLGENLQIQRPVGILAPGDGELYNKLLRINHFGANANQESVEEAIRTLSELMHREPRDAISAERKVWNNNDGKRASV